MTDLGVVIWGALTAAGGTLALTLIIAMAVGINGLTLLFAGSAVVALDQFAQAVRHWRSVVGVGLASAGLLGLALIQSQVPEFRLPHDRSSSCIAFCPLVIDAISSRGWMARQCRRPI